MKLTFLDYKSIGEDIDLSIFETFGTVEKYNLLKPQEIGDKLKDTDIVIVNKMPMNEQTLAGAKKLKLICVTATGTNNLDKEYLKKRSIEWRNVAGYSTECVTQHTFALLFYIYENLAYYDQYVKCGRYASDGMFTHFERHFHELNGKTWGIIGMGAIGSRVAQVASVFGCRVIYYSTSGKNHREDYEEVTFEELLSCADIVSVHAPLDENTLHLMNRQAFEKMKPTAVFLNVGRGPIVVEQDLADALEQGEIAAAALDVLSEEPMNPQNPLQKIKDSTKLLITPHIAWAGVETRRRLMDIIYHQIEDFLKEENMI
jgi:glycerate dehydrogenase